jgi:hypothetical protein
MNQLSLVDGQDCLTAQARQSLQWRRNQSLE